MYIFVITSTLNPKYGLTHVPSLVSPTDRFNQTLNTIESIRTKVPDSIILLLDSSPFPVEDYKVDAIRPKVDYYISLFNHTHAMELGLMGHKSAAETYIMIVAMDVIRNLAREDITRIFKITGRGELSENFDISFYEKEEVKGKYVFQTPVVSWMSPQLKLVNTRLWSFDYSLFNETEQLFRQAYEECLPGRFDLEHVYYKLIDKEKLYGKDIIGLKCQVAGNGMIVDE